MTSKLSLQERMIRLRDLMQNAADLYEPIDYFVQSLASERKFIRQSKRGNPRLTPILHSIARRNFGPETPAPRMKFRRYGKLWHGGEFVGVDPAVAIYHTELDIGIFAVHIGRRRETTRFTVLGGSPVPDEHETDTDDLN